MLITNAFSLLTHPLPLQAARGFVPPLEIGDLAGRLDLLLAGGAPRSDLRLALPSPLALWDRLVETGDAQPLSQGAHVVPRVPGEAVDRWLRYVEAQHRLVGPAVELGLKLLLGNTVVSAETALFADMLRRGLPGDYPLELRLMTPAVSQWFLQRTGEIRRQASDFVFLETEQGLIDFEGYRSVYYWRHRPRPGFAMLARPEADSLSLGGSLGTIVALHGLFQDRQSLLESLLEPLALQYYSELWTYDQPGFGFSKGFWNPEQDETFLLAAIRILERARYESAGPVTLLGYSMGGIVAAQVATVRPDLIDRLVLIATPFQPRREDQMIALSHDLERNAAQIAAGDLRAPTLRGFAPREVLQGLKGARWNVAFADTIHRMAARFRESGFSCVRPTLIVFNPHDAMVDPIGLRVLGEPIPDHVQLVRWEESSPSGRASRAHDIYCHPTVRGEVGRFIGAGYPSRDQRVMAWRDFDRHLAGRDLHRVGAHIVSRLD